MFDNFKIEDIADKYKELYKSRIKYMKVLFDHQIFQNQRIGGISRYFSEIIKHFPSSVEVDLSVKYSFNEYLKGTNHDFEWRYQLGNQIIPSLSFPGKRHFLKLCEKQFPKKYPNRRWENESKTLDKLQKGDFDVFHPTFFDDYYLDALNGKPFVFTVHDMIPELYPEFLNNPHFVERKRKLINRAAHIIAVSDNTKSDLIEVYGLNPAKITVIHHASSLLVSDSTIELPSNYILFVGDRRLGYKNFLFFLSAMAPILKENPSLKILCTGHEFVPTELTHFENLGVQNQMQHIYVADTDLYTCYKKARMFVFPSYYEGFGIPVLEAFQSDCPVILADASCFREIAGDAALYFQPKSPTQLQAHVQTLLSDSVMRDEMVKKGRLQFANYSWAKAAQETLDVYKLVLNKQ